MKWNEKCGHGKYCRLKCTSWMKRKKNRVKFDTEMLLSAYSLRPNGFCDWMKYNYDWHIWLRFKFAHFSMQWILGKMQLIVGSSRSDRHSTAQHKIESNSKRNRADSKISNDLVFELKLHFWLSKNLYIEKLRNPNYTGSVSLFDSISNTKRHKFYMEYSWETSAILNYETFTMDS